MDDKELLELAAKANWPEESEVSFWFDAREDEIIFIDADNQDHNGQDVEFRWNPLTDDGDALRLAVKLGLSIRIKNSILATIIGYYKEDQIGELHRDDPYAATRRAIVRAAAAIGQSQQRSK